MGRRVLAVIGAVALVLTAIVVRSVIEGDDGGSPADGAHDGEEVVVCDTDFADECRVGLEGVTLRIEDSATTSATLLDEGRGDVDAWITSNAWFELTQHRLAAQGSNVEVGFATPLATARVVVAAVAARADAITTLCDARGTWRCLGEEAGRPWSEVGGQPSWGPVRTGLPSAETAVGLSTLAAAAAGYFGGTDFAANDFPAAFAPWLDSLARASGEGDPDLLTTLVRRQGTYDAGGVLEHLARPRPELVVLPVDGGPAAEVVAVALSDDATDRWPELQGALVGAGWTASEPAGGPTGVLGPGVTGALYSLWKDVAR